MANKKTGINFVCPNCFKEFYVIKSRIDKSITHYCSLKCSSKVMASKRRIFPKKVGNCKECDGEIIAKNKSFDKPNRNFCSHKCATIWRNKTTPKTEAQIQMIIKIGKDSKGKPKKLGFGEKIKEANLGEKSHFWKGGLTEKNRLLRNSAKMQEWRKCVFERDNYKCVLCGINGYLEADHIKPFSKYPELRFELSNGRTLCKPCHRSTETFGRKKDYQN